MTEATKGSQQTLEDYLGGMVNRKESSMVDVAKALITPENVVMITDIPSPDMLSAIKLAEMTAAQQGFPLTEKFWKELYRCKLLHEVSHNRKSRQEVVDTFRGFFEAEDRMKRQKAGMWGNGQR